MFKSWRNWLTGMFTFAYWGTRRRATKSSARRKPPLHNEELQTRGVPPCIETDASHPWIEPDTMHQWVDPDPGMHWDGEGI